MYLFGNVISIVIGIVIGIISGIWMGCSIAVLLTVNKVRTSNDIGDSGGTFEDYGTQIRILEQEDGIRDFIRYEQGYDSSIYTYKRE